MIKSYGNIEELFQSLAKLTHDNAQQFKFTGKAMHLKGIVPFCHFRKCVVLQSKTSRTAKVVITLKQDQLVDAHMVI